MVLFKKWYIALFVVAFTTLIAAPSAYAEDASVIIDGIGSAYIDLDFSDASGLSLKGDAAIEDGALKLNGKPGTYATVNKSDLAAQGGKITISIDVNASLRATQTQTLFSIGAPAVDDAHEEAAIIISATRNNTIVSIAAGAATATPSRVQTQGTYPATYRVNNITVTYDSDNGKLEQYQNGALVQTVTGTVDLEDILKAPGASVTIGSPESPFNGSILGIKVYNFIPTQGELAALGFSVLLEGDLEYLTLDTDADLLYNEQKIHNPVIHDVLLWQRSKVNSFPITYSLSTTDILSIDHDSNGLNHFARFDETKVDATTDKTVTLTATLTATGPDGPIEASKDLELLVASWKTRRQMDLDAITIVNQDDIRESLPLQAAGKYGSTIDWRSSDPSVVTDSKIAGIDDPYPGGGVVTRPEAGKDPIEVKLTATVTIPGISGELTRDYFVTIMPITPGLDVPREKYLWTYYSERQDWNQDGETAEEMYFAISEDGWNWKYLNIKTRPDGTIYTEPILSSTVGDMGLRDAHFVRSGYSDRFYAMATDLHAVGTVLTTPGVKKAWHPSGTNFTWDNLNGARTLAVWDSNSLTEWGDPRLVKCNFDFAGNTYAPESIWDPVRQAHLVYWSSRNAAELKENGDLNTNGQICIYYCYTRDFVTFTEPTFWFGYDYVDDLFFNAGIRGKGQATQLLDTHIVYDESDGYFYRFTAGPGRCFVDRSRTLDPDQSNWVDLTLIESFAQPGQPTRTSYEAPTTYRLPDGSWMLMLDNYTEYIPFHAIKTGKLVDFMTSGDFKIATTTGSISLNPPYPGTTGRTMPPVKHGMVLPISDREYGALLAAYGTLDDVAVDWTVDYVAVTPAAVNVGFGSVSYYSAKVIGKNTPPQTVVWSVKGASSPGTTINPTSGALSVAVDETALTLTVTATHVHPYFDTLYGTATVSVVPAAPRITTQPTAAVTVDEGSSITLTVTATVSDGGTLTYRWYKDGSPRSGATGSSITINNSRISDSGSYYAVVTNTGANGATATAQSVSSTVTVESVSLSEAFDVTFDGNGGIWPSGAAIIVNVPAGQVLTSTSALLPSAPYNPLSNFAGWYTDKTAGTGIEWPVTKAGIYYAHWQAKPGGWVRPPDNSTTSPGTGVDPAASATPGASIATPGAVTSDLPLITGPISGFSDASGISGWAVPFIEKLVQAGVLSGYSDGSLKPQGNITRAEFTKMIVVGLKLKAGGTAKSFPDDVKTGDWYKEFVDIASANSIVNGVSATGFAPDANISRQDLAAIAYRALAYLNVAVPAPSAIKFSDDAGIADYAKDAVYVLRELAIVGGRTDGSFDPLALATREEAAKIICGVMDYVTATVAAQAAPVIDATTPLDGTAPEGTTTETAITSESALSINK